MIHNKFKVETKFIEVYKYLKKFKNVVKLGSFQLRYECFIFKDVQTFKRRLDLQLGILDFYYKSFGVKDSKIETFVPYWLEADKKKKEEQVFI